MGDATVPPDSTTERKSKRITRGVLWRTALVALVVTYLVCRFSHSLCELEYGLYDLLMKYRRSPTDHSSIVLVEAKASDVEPHPPAGCECDGVLRRDYAQVVRNLREYGAPVIVLDVRFPYPCPVCDEDLRTATGAAGDVVVAADVASRAGVLDVHIKQPAEGATGSAAVGSPLTYNPRGVVRSIRLVQRSVRPEEQPRPELEDIVEVVGKPYAPIAALAVALWEGHSLEPPSPLDPHTVPVASHRPPTWDTASIQLLDYLGLLPAPAENENAYAMLVSFPRASDSLPRVPFSAVRDGELGDRSRVAGKIAVIGGVGDEVFTAVGTMPGAAIHASAIETLIDDRYIRPLPVPAIWAMIFCLSWLGALTAIRQPAVSVSVLILGAGAVLIIVEWLLLGHGVWMYSALPLVALVATSWPVEIYAYARAERQMARMAREIQLRREVMTSVIHDLKQPLFAIQMSAQTLLRRAQSAMDTGSAERLLQIIERQTKRLTQQINTLLEADPSRPVRPAVRPVDLGQLVRDQVELNRGMAADGHTVAYEGPDGEVIATADPDLVGRAVANLLGNAIKYSPDGGAVTVSMNVARGSARISVADQGLGIPAAHQQQVLEPFSRAHPERTDIEGTGLGLFSARRIAESHDGELTFVSREGAGSTFTLRLPLSGPVSVEQE